MDKYIGKLLDNRYEILEVIGTGGMAVVYKARCHRLNRLVAVKVLKEDLALDADFRRRFHTESQAVAMLSHPNIVAVYDVSRTSDIEYIVMELIDGITLKQYMQRKKTLSWKEALHFTTQIVKALSHAHSKGIIHRDIKPHNIMILRDGSVKVADFGIARVTSSQNTLTQDALGSVHYISPEQAKGSHIDARSDIYSVGVVMYEMITGRLPYEGDSPVSIALQHINSVPLSPKEINPDIPEALELITTKAMAPNVENRYHSINEMLEDLEEFRKNPNVVFDYKTSGLLQETIDNEPTVIIKKPLQEKNRKYADEHKESAYEYDKKEEIRRKNQRARRVSVFAGVLAVLIFITGITYFLWVFFVSDFFTPTQDLTVPNIVGLNIDYVETSSQYDEFEIFIEGYKSSDIYPENTIITQDPVAQRKVKSGSVISVIVSSGTDRVVMPNVANKEYRTALYELRNLGLEPTTEYSHSDTVTSGYVISAMPETGTELTIGTKVYLVISTGPEIVMVNVPNFIDMTEEDAKRAIERAGLVVGEIKREENEKEAGRVIYQSPRADSEVEEKTVVDLTISTGPAVTPTPEPPISPEVSPTYTYDPLGPEGY